MLKKDLGIILMIISHCDRIKTKLQATTKEFFLKDDDLKEIIAFNLFQIGELANKLSEDFVIAYNKIPWKQIRGLRNRICHGYESIDLEIIWNTANESIEELNQYCTLIIQEN